jgi:hypothetical protein
MTIRLLWAAHSLPDATDKSAIPRGKSQPDLNAYAAINFLNSTSILQQPN